MNGCGGLCLFKNAIKVIFVSVTLKAYSQGTSYTVSRVY